MARAAPRDAALQGGARSWRVGSGATGPMKPNANRAAFGSSRPYPCATHTEPRKWHGSPLPRGREPPPPSRLEIALDDVLRALVLGLTAKPPRRRPQAPQKRHAHR